MVPGIDPKVDYAFKRVFGSEANIPLLRDLLEAVLQPPPDQHITDLEISNPFNDKESLDDKLSILDIKVRDQRGVQYNVEMQMASTVVYPQRVLYYWARLHSQQLREGDDYKKLQATISISFLNGILFPQRPEYHLAFQLCEPRWPELVFSEHLAVHLIELPKFRKKVEELASPLEIWTYFLIHGGELDRDNLPANLRETNVRKAVEVLTMMTQSELERERYEARLKAWRDERARQDEVEEARQNRAEAKKALAEAEQALAEADQALAEQTSAAAEGIQIGEIVGRIHVCQRILKVPLTPKSDLLSKSIDELESLATTLERQLGLVG